MVRIQFPDPKKRSAQKVGLKGQSKRSDRKVSHKGRVERSSMLVLDVAMTDSNRFVHLSDETLKKASEAYLDKHGVESKNFSKLIEQSQKFKLAQLTPYYIIDQESGEMMCLVEEYLNCPGNA